MRSTVINNYEQCFTFEIFFFQKYEIENAFQRGKNNVTIYYLLFGECGDFREYEI